MVFHRPRFTSLLGSCLLAGSVSAAAQPSPVSVKARAIARRIVQAERAQQPVPSIPLSHLTVTGARYFTEADIAAFLELRPGSRLPAAPQALAEETKRHYVERGYSFAQVSARFDETTGELKLDVDEGHIDAIEFAGVPDRLAAAFAQEFALQPGDVFHRPEANRALGVLLRPTEGAIRPADSSGKPSADRRRPWRPLGMPFDMITRGDKRVLIVHLASRQSDLAVSMGTEGRNDWFDPVDGFAPAIRFSETIFDRVRFNHTYITGNVSYKFGRDHAGYAIGFERPFLTDRRVFLGAEYHGDTATDDQWRLSTMEQSLAAAGFRATFRDYYERRGYQLNASVQFGAGHELQASWRDERQVALVNASDFSVFRRDQAYRPNAGAEPGTLHALLFGYTWDSRGLRDETRAERYERHQLIDLFGTSGGEDPGWRLEWTSEIASPDALGGTFDYRRHILNLRRYNRLSHRNALNLRAIAGIGEGSLPPQRLFGIGGLGSLPAYAFKQAAGERMLLFSADYELRLHRDFRPLLLYDVGRVFRPVGGSSEDWMHAFGTGVQLGDSLRVEVFWPLTGPRPAEMVVRLRPSF